jgi:hypothetical protein
VVTLGGAWAVGTAALHEAGPPSRTTDTIMMSLILIGVAALFRLAWEVVDHVRNR